MDLSIIIVSWNVRALLEKCLRSIERYGSPSTGSGCTIEVFVVDNASNDGTVDWIKTFHASRFALHVIENNANRGFAAANNQGITQATGEYVLLLNPDTEFQEVSLQKMLAFMESHPRCGVLGPKLLNSDGSHQPSVRRLPDAWSPTLLSLGIVRGLARLYLALDMDYSKSQQVEQVMGACLLTRRALIDQIGSLDERFFIWFEEVDFCKRAADARWEVWYTPDAAVIHHGGQSFAQVLTLRKQWWFSRSLLYFFWKHRRWGAWILNVLLVPFRLIVSVMIKK